MISLTNFLALLGILLMAYEIGYYVWSHWVVAEYVTKNKLRTRRWYSRNFAGAFSLFVLVFIGATGWAQRTHYLDEIQLQKTQIESMETSKRDSETQKLTLEGTLNQAKLSYDDLQRKYAAIQTKSYSLENFLLLCLPIAHEFDRVKQTIVETRKQLSALRQDSRTELQATERWNYIKRLLNRLRNRNLSDFVTQELSIDEIEAQIYALQKASDQVLTDLESLDNQLLSLEKNVNALYENFNLIVFARIGPERKHLKL